MITREYWYDMMDGKGRKPKYCEKNLSQLCFAHPESQVDCLWIEPTCYEKLKIKLAQLWHSLLNACHKINPQWWKHQRERKWKWLMVDIQGTAFNVTHFESRITRLLYTAINTTEHG